MSTSKDRNNKLAVLLASDSRYILQKNGTIKKIGSDGKYRAIGTERHGYNVVNYRGKRVVTARVYAARTLLEAGYTQSQVTGVLSNYVVQRANGVSLDDRMVNLRIRTPSRVKRSATRRLSQKQISRMVELFFDGYSVAKIARRFRRKISRSHVSQVIRRELGIETVGV